jgi:hypothetical protein
MRVRSLGIGAVALAALLTIPACGGNSDEAKVRQAVADYLDEVGEQDYKAACGFLHNDAKTKLGSDCAAGLQQRYSALSVDVRDELDEINVDDVVIKGTTATVANDEIEVKSTSKTRRKGKTKSKTSYHQAPDVTGGSGFTLKKAGSDWQITSGV